MKQFKKIIPFVVTLTFVVLIFVFGAINVSAKTYSGNCGSWAYWDYDTSTHVLSIYGSGNMYDYDYLQKLPPWNEYSWEIETVIFDDSISYIGSYAFLHCSNIKKVELPARLIRIGKDSFSSCSKLTSLIIPDSVKYIEDYAFSGCRSLSNITFGANIETIGNGSFEHCSISNIKLGKAVKSIGYYAFAFCSYLDSAFIPDSVESIGRSAFVDCSHTFDIICHDDTYAETYALSNQLGCLIYEYGSYVYNDDATCTKNGTKTRFCECGCGRKETTSAENTALGHSYSKWITLTKPTDDTAGLEERRCSVCDFKEQRNISRLERFIDVKKGHWFYDAVDYCVKHEYVSGMTESTFAPNGKLTRAQFLLMLSKLAGVDIKAYNSLDSGFTDVKPEHWYNGAVVWAVKYGYTSGISDTKFAPNNSVTRAQLARFFYVYSENNGIKISGKADISAFPDASKVAAWAKTPIEWAVNAGLISGVSKGDADYLDPNGSATRAQAAVMFRAFDYFRGIYK